MRTKDHRLNNDKEERRARVAMAKLGRYFGPLLEQADHLRGVLDEIEAELSAIRSGKKVSDQPFRDGHESPASHVPLTHHIEVAEANGSR